MKVSGEDLTESLRQANANIDAQAILIDEMRQERQELRGKLRRAEGLISDYRRQLDAAIRIVELVRNRQARTDDCLRALQQYDAEFPS